MLHNEYQISTPFKTQVHVKLGLPRHTVILTNRRMIVSCKQRFLFFFKHEWETSVLYKCASPFKGACRHMPPPSYKLALRVWRCCMLHDKRRTHDQAAAGRTRGGP